MIDIPDTDNLTTFDEKRYRRAVYNPFSIVTDAPGMYVVRSLKNNKPYKVDTYDGACECQDFQYNAAKRNSPCKHIWFAHLVETGVLCETCGYKSHRPSCPNRFRNNADNTTENNE